jgi:hypothetical protein
MIKRIKKRLENVQRTSTKIVIILLVYLAVMGAVLIPWLVIGIPLLIANDKTLLPLKDVIAPIITALIGGGVLPFLGNLVRVIFENVFGKGLPGKGGGQDENNPG